MKKMFLAFLASLVLANTNVLAGEEIHLAAAIGGASTPPVETTSSPAGTTSGGATSGGATATGGATAAGGATVAAGTTVGLSTTTLVTIGVLGAGAVGALAGGGSSSTSNH